MRKEVIFIVILTFIITASCSPNFAGLATTLDEGKQMPPSLDTTVARALPDIQLKAQRICSRRAADWAVAADWSVNVQETYARMSTNSNAQEDLTVLDGRIFLSGEPPYGYLPTSYPKTSANLPLLPEMK